MLQQAGTDLAAPAVPALHLAYSFAPVKAVFNATPAWKGQHFVPSEHRHKGQPTAQGSKALSPPSVFPLCSKGLIQNTPDMVAQISWPTPRQRRLVKERRRLSSWGALKASKGQEVAELCESGGGCSVSKSQFSFFCHEVIRNTMLSRAWVSGSFPNASVIYDPEAGRGGKNRKKNCFVFLQKLCPSESGGRIGPWLGCRPGNTRTLFSPLLHHNLPM